MKCGLFRYGIPFLALAVLLSACNQADLMVNTGTAAVYPSTVFKVDVNSAGYGVLRLDELHDDDVYLVKVNASRIAYSTNIISTGASAEREQTPEGSRSPAGTITMPDGEERVVYEPHWQMVPPPEDEITLNRSITASLAQTDTGDKSSFFVDVSPTQAVYERKSATLRKVGLYCKIWVADDNFDSGSSLPTDNKVNQSQVDELAQKFDEIYPIETNILGYECGGGPGGNGGVDGDPKVQILVIDIDGDSGDHAGSTIMGYFYPGDEYRRGSTYPYSNESEIFYLDSDIMDSNPQAIYSTLIHEFNHMINYNIKVLEGGHMRVWNNEVWYTEMLSMLAEDTIGPLVGIEPAASGHVTHERIPKWLESYTDISVMYWPSSPSASLPYYSSNYAFGAYLVRNFGGPALFSSIAKSYAAGRASIDACLRVLNGREIDTAYALERFGEALVYSGDTLPADVYSYDKTASGTIGNRLYTFERFNIWDIACYAFGASQHGPVVRAYSRINDYSMPLNTLQLYTDDTWKQASGRLDIVLRNVGTNATYFVMVK
jgi:hypothetical protein